MERLLRHALIVAAICLALPAAAFGSGDLTVQIVGVGHVTGEPVGVTGSPIDCSQPPGADGVCQAHYEDDELCEPNRACIPLPASAALEAGSTNGWMFDRWVGCGDDDWQPRCEVRMDRDRTVTAHFVDVWRPSVTIVEPPPGVVHGTVSFRADATDNHVVDRVEFRVNGVLVRTDYVRPYLVTVDTTKLPDGSATFTATAFDRAGNAGTSPARRVTVDNTGPVVAFSGGPADGATLAPQTSPAWTFEASDAWSRVAAVECSVAADGAAPAWGPCSGGTGEHTVTGLAPGAYVIGVRATDGEGNVGPVASRRFTIAEPPPPASSAPPAVAAPGVAPAAPAAPPAGPSLPARVRALLSRSLREAEADRRLRRVLVPVTCPAQQRSACEGTLSAQTRERYRTRSGRSARLRLRSRRFEVEQGSTERIALTLPRAVRSRLRRGRPTRLLVRVSERDAGGRLRHGGRRTIRVVALRRSLRATRSGSVRVRLLFPVVADRQSKARVELNHGRRVAATARSVTPRPGRTVRATLRLSRSTARLLARRGSVRLTLRLEHRDADGRAQVRRRTLTVRR